MGLFVFPPLPAELAEAYGVYERQPTRQSRASSPTSLPLTTTQRTIHYDYDSLYRLTNATYSTGESFAYEYDAVGNRLKQIISGDTTSYTYDAANRLNMVEGVAYLYDDNGNLLQSDSLTNTWDAANRLVETTSNDTTLQPIYDGLGNRVGQTQGVSTTWYALDVAVGLPEVVYTSEGNKYLHLPGVIMTESASGEVRYLLSDGLGSIRHATAETGAVVSRTRILTDARLGWAGSVRCIGVPSVSGS